MYDCTGAILTPEAAGYPLAERDYVSNNCNFLFYFLFFAALPFRKLTEREGLKGFVHGAQAVPNCELMAYPADSWMQDWHLLNLSLCPEEKGGTILASNML